MSEIKVGWKPELDANWDRCFPKKQDSTAIAFRTTAPEPCGCGMKILPNGRARYVRCVQHGGDPR